MCKSWFSYLIILEIFEIANDQESEGGLGMGIKMNQIDAPKVIPQDTPIREGNTQKCSPQPQGCLFLLWLPLCASCPAIQLQPHTAFFMDTTVNIPGALLSAR